MSHHMGRPSRRSTGHIPGATAANSTLRPRRVRKGLKMASQGQRPAETNAHAPVSDGADMIGPRLALDRLGHWLSRRRSRPTRWPPSRSGTPSRAASPCTPPVAVRGGGTIELPHWGRSSRRPRGSQPRWFRTEHEFPPCRPCGRCRDGSRRRRAVQQGVNAFRNLTEDRLPSRVRPFNSAAGPPRLPAERGRSKAEGGSDD